MAQNDLGSEISKILGVDLGGGLNPTANPNDPRIMVTKAPSKSPFSTTTKGLNPAKYGTYKSASQLQQGLFKMSDAELRKLQERLYQGGFYGAQTSRADIDWGNVDETTLAAYNVLLTRAANFGLAGVSVTLDEVLAKAGKGGGGPKGEKKQPFNPQLADPDDLKLVFRIASTAVLGRAVDDAELEQLAVTYRQRQLEALQTNYDMTSAEQAGQLATVPDPQTYAQNEMWRTRPGEAGARELRGYMDEFVGLLDGVGGG